MYTLKMDTNINQQQLDRLNNALLTAIKLIPLSENQIKRIDFSQLNVQLKQAVLLAQEIESISYDQKGLPRVP